MIFKNKQGNIQKKMYFSSPSDGLGKPSNKYKPAFAQQL